MKLEIDDQELQNVIERALASKMAELDWPANRIALSEEEAAKACGVNRHVLRDKRLSKKLKATKLGKKVVYTREQLLTFLNDSRMDDGKSGLGNPQRD